MTWIKVCGITSTSDAEAAIEAGVSAIGLVFAKSPRQVALAKALEIAAFVRGRVEIVGVFKDARQVEAVHGALRFDRVQIHGPGPLRVAVPVLRAIRPEEIEKPGSVNDGEMVLIDGSEGRGQPFDGARLRSQPGPLVIAGGLTPENVGDAILAVRPFGVDVSSGVESLPGRKDPEKMRRFVAAVRRADGVR